MSSPISALTLDSLTALLSAIAVQWSIKTNLEIRTSTLQAVPPLEGQEEQRPISPVETPPRSRLQKLAPNTAQWYLIAQMLGILFIGIILPRYGTTFLVDLAWGSVELALLTFVYKRASESLLHIPKLLRYVQPRSRSMKMYYLEDRPVDPTSWYHQDSFRTALGGVCAALTVLGLAMGYRLVLAAVPAAWALCLISAFVGPSMSIRGYTYLMLVSHGIVGVVTGIAIPIAEHYFPSDPAVPKNPGVAHSSAWLSELMMSFIWMFVIVFPAGLIDITNRFEHDRTISLPAASPGEAVLIKHDKPFLIPFYSPNRSTVNLAWIGGVAYASSLCVWVVLREVCKDDKNTVEMLGACGSVLTLGATLVGTAGAAFVQGRWKEWWGYYEEWALLESVNIEDGTGVLETSETIAVKT